MFQKLVLDELVLLDTADLRNYIDDRLEVPADPDQCYIVDWSIDDSDVVTGKPRFTVTFTTVNLLRRLRSQFIQDDATYKMNWMGYPVLTHGVSTDTGRFFLTHITLSSHEDTKILGDQLQLCQTRRRGPKIQHGRWCLGDLEWSR